MLQFVQQALEENQLLTQDGADSNGDVQMQVPARDTEMSSGEPNPRVPPQQK